MKTILFLVFAMIIAAMVVLLAPMYYTPTCNVGDEALRKARTVARLCHIAFACGECRVQSFDDVWRTDGTVDCPACPASERLIEYLSCVYSNDLTRQELIMTNEDKADFNRIVQDGWGNIIRAAWWTDIKGERLERTKRVGNLVIWSVGANGVDERGEGDDITMGVDLEVTVP